MASQWDWLFNQMGSKTPSDGASEEQQQEATERASLENQQIRRSFVPGSPYSSLRGGTGSNEGTGSLVTGDNGRYQSSLMGMLELLKDAEKSTMGGYRSDAERDASSLQASRLRNLLGDRINDPGRLGANRSSGGSFGGGGVSSRRSGINQSALGQIESFKNKAREEEAYQLHQQKSGLDLASQKNALAAQRYETSRRPDMDSFKRTLILQLLRGVM